ncbi:ubiquitin carboxyl-terminal hydrolase 5 [Strongylocentrotus purpuratus]|uniref:Ubiquitin carboxyl-terminal hydrolase n=1 Tax=Strongylocentrotus purpuratus TaxID=7668 RepID=A0A7M7NZ42_STRPU|nr:ubiquitin carboxyl-terminal hydrolase 5 [Strongylocentrotus purpuratus]
MAASKLHEFLDKIRIPGAGDKVYKDECAYCFDNPESETGLFVCMNTFLGFGKDYVRRHYERTKNPVYLHLKTIKKKKPKTEEEKEKEKPTRLAIGMQGGFDVEDENQYEYEEHNSVVILPDFTEIPLPNAELPEEVQLSIASILSATSASKAEQIQAWDGEAKILSRHAANLKQLDNGVKVPPKGWKCSMCDLKDNLWMNLTDGTILCGRRYFDGTGGNNHAVEQYDQTKYPLAVKLGTITPNGADVYSYVEDEMVDDPLLATHLTHFGINMMNMEKTDKTMTELEIDLNMRVAEWDTIQESGSQLKPLFGPGLTGLKNMGNSCYLNSVMQVLFSIPDFVNRYASKKDEIFTSAPADPRGDFNVQMAKLGYGLASGRYSQEPKTTDSGDQSEAKKQSGVAPRMFKSLVGKGHQEFSTNRQQDAQEYLLHLFSIIERHSRNLNNPCDCLQLELEERIQCSQSNQVKYKKRTDYILAVPIPLEAATNLNAFVAYQAKKAELEAKKERVDPKDIVRPHICLQDCLEAFAAQEKVEDFYSAAINAKTVALRSTRIASFPDFLIIQLKKFTLGEDWTPKKLDVSVDMPDELDLSRYRGNGIQPGETELPDGDGPPEPEPVIDEGMVSLLAEMGFAKEGCRKAVYHTKNTGTDAAMNWIFEHSADPDFAEPLQLGQAKKKQKTEIVASEEGIMMIMSMGFTREQSIKALRATDNNLERAADWIFSHPDELLDTPMETEQPSGPTCRDGNGKYQLFAFVSHMGTSTACGHYVCHIKKEGRWVIFNDDKVAQSEKPPKDLGYIYFYKRLN